MPKRTPLSRIRRGSMVLIVVLAAAIVGYRMLTGRDWIEAIYMVVITVASVGFTEQSTLDAPLQIYFTLLVVLGMSAAGYTIGGLFQMMTEGEIDRAIGLKRANREIMRLKDHVILCGYGRTGSVLAQQLARQKEPFVILDRSAERIAEAQEAGYLVLTGDATQEEVLLAAGVERAKSLVTVLKNDADSVFIALSARNINKDLQIIARAEHQSSQKKLIQAGANRVVLPATIGAQRIATLLLRPSTVELFELVTEKAELDVEVDELRIPADSSLVGRTARDAEARRTHGLLIVAIKQSAGRMLFNPDADHQFEAGDTLIVMGNQSDILRFRQQHGL